MPLSPKERVFGLDAMRALAISSRFDAVGTGRAVAKLFRSPTILSD